MHFIAYNYIYLQLAAGFLMVQFSSVPTVVMEPL